MLVHQRVFYKNGDFPIKNGDFPIKNGDFPLKNGDFPIKHGDFPIPPKKTAHPKHHHVLRRRGQSIADNVEAWGVMSRSFGGTASTAPEGTTDWILGASLREKWDDPRRRAMLDWMMKAGLGSGAPSR